MLSDSPSIQEILWNFSRFKDEKQRLTLMQNPHFYAELPTLLEAYGDSLKIDPTEDFQHGNKFYVLTDKPELLHVKIGEASQFFGNFWCPQNAVIFKGWTAFPLPPPLLLCLARHLWEAQGRKPYQGISRRHILRVLWAVPSVHRSNSLQESLSWIATSYHGKVLNDRVEIFNGLSPNAQFCGFPAGRTHFARFTCLYWASGTR